MSTGLAHGYGEHTRYTFRLFHFPFFSKPFNLLPCILLIYGTSASRSTHSHLRVRHVMTVSRHRYPNTPKGPDSTITKVTIPLHNKRIHLRRVIRSSPANKHAINAPGSQDPRNGLLHARSFTCGFLHDVFFSIDARC